MQKPDYIVKYDFNEFKILIISESLIKGVISGFSFHIDDTYKLIDINHSNIVFGISDMKGSFHLTGFAILYNENTNTYE